MVVPRLVGELNGSVDPAPIGDIWRDTVVVLDELRPGERYRNEFTGAWLELDAEAEACLIPLESLLEDFPVALYGTAPKRAAGNNLPKGHR